MTVSISGNGPITGSDRAPTLSPVLTTPTLGDAVVSSINGGQLAGFKNRIINGDCAIAQRGNIGATTLSTINFCADRWYYRCDVAGVTYSMNQYTGSLSANGFHHLGTIALTVKASLLAGEYYVVGQNIEGTAVKDLKWGSSSAKPITISFRATASQTTVVSLAIRNGAYNRSYVVPITINPANATPFYSVTIPGDTSGIWQSDITLGISVSFTLAAGSTYITSTSNSWQAANVVAHTTNSNLFDTLNRSFSITDLQLEAGSVATPFEARPYGTELALCQRYYYQSPLQNFTIRTLQPGGAVTLGFGEPLPVQMRTTPTVTFPTYLTDANYMNASPTASKWTLLQDNVAYLTKTGTVTFLPVYSDRFIGTLLYGATWNIPCTVMIVDTTQPLYKASAEL